MRKILAWAFILATAACATPVTAQTPPVGKEVPPPVRETPEADSPAAAAENPAPTVEAKKAPSTTPVEPKRKTAAETKGKRGAAQARHRRHARGSRRHRVARQMWRDVWVYDAHDPHGVRRYYYASRSFGGYFATSR
jgi:hypothetical protein